MPNTIETLLFDEKICIDMYRRARNAQHATLEIHIQDGKLVHINLTEKFKPGNGLATLREVSGAAL